MPVTEEQIKRIMVSKGVRESCPMCNRTAGWQTAAKFTQDSMSDEPLDVTLGENMVPMIMLICAHCGFVSRHAAAVLGLMD